jgi:SAM-dependent methyltransferase
MAHLEWLRLPLDNRSVLDVGGGVGHLAQFFVERGCRVVCTEARPENVEVMRRIYPGLDGRVADVEAELAEFGTFEVVFCYGLLYHLENPLRALRNLVAACSDLLLIESQICDSPFPLARLDDEYLSQNQALRGLAHRPSPTYVAMALDRLGVHHVYTAVSPPRHPDYEFERLGDLAVKRGDHLLRQIFVASRTPLDNDRLTPLLDVV